MKPFLMSMKTPIKTNTRNICFQFLAERGGGLGAGPGGGACGEGGVRPPCRSGSRAAAWGWAEPPPVAWSSPGGGPSGTSAAGWRCYEDTPRSARCRRRSCIKAHGTSKAEAPHHQHIKEGGGASAILPSCKDTSCGGEGTAEAVGQGGHGLRSPFLDAPEPDQAEEGKRVASVPPVWDAWVPHNNPPTPGPIERRCLGQTRTHMIS